jgi:hypothetical protein
LVVTVDFSLLSSEQPEIPIPKPIMMALINIKLVSFRMAQTSDWESRRPVTSRKIRRLAANDWKRRKQEACQSSALLPFLDAVYQMALVSFFRPSAIFPALPACHGERRDG